MIAASRQSGRARISLASPLSAMGATLIFEGRVALISGAGSGLGRSYALELAKRGCKIVVNDYGGVSAGVTAGSSGNMDKAQSVVDEIIAGGGEAIPDGGSVAEFEDVAAMVAKAVEQWGRLDIAIVNAGIYRDRRIERVTEEDFDLTMSVHIKGAFNIVKNAWPVMRHQEYGRILLTSSGASFGAKNYWLYGTAKAAMIGMANNLKHEGKDLNIKVNCLMPGAATAMTASNPNQSEEDKAKAAERMPPELVTCAAVFLCHEENIDSGECIVAESGSYGRAALALGPQVKPHFSEGPKNAEWIRDNFDTILSLSAEGENKIDEWTLQDGFAVKNKGTPYGRHVRHSNM